MPQRSVYVDDETDRAMRELSAVNWSRVAQDAFRVAIEAERRRLARDWLFVTQPEPPAAPAKVTP